MKNRLFFVLMTLSLTFCSQKPKGTYLEDNNEGIQTVFSFPKKYKEISGIQLSPNGKEIYAHEDQGNDNEILIFDFAGNLTRKVTIEGVLNNDWEDIAQDNSGNTYIGDFGNNKNERKNLAIYKVRLGENNSVPVLQTTHFNYPEQTKFPPKKSDLLYDCEAFIVLNDYFYLFTKNRSKGFDGTSLIYKIPNKEGSFNAKLLNNLKLDGNFNEAAITGADISPDKKTIALITHKVVYLLKNFESSDFKDFTIIPIKLHNNSQKEGICFTSNTELLIADERSNKVGGNLYKLNIEEYLK